MRFTRLYVSIFAFLFGIFGASVGGSTIAFSVFVILLGVSIGTYARVVAQREYMPQVVIVALCLMCFGAGMLRFELSPFADREGVLDNFVGQKVVVEGIITAEAEPRSAHLRLVVSPDVVNGDSVAKGNTMRILVSAERFPEFEYGDRIRVAGKLKLPENFETEQGRMFDYVSYLKKDRIRYQILYPEVTLQEKGQGNMLVSALLRVKRGFADNLALLMPEPASALASGIVVGGKRSIGEDLLQDFRTVGLIHIIVLSGYNLTLIAKTVSAFFGYFFGRKWTFLCATLSIILFALMTGATATVVRASFMAFLVVLAKATGRLSSLGHALIIAGFGMVLFNPSILVFDPSFQLSFIATLALVQFAPFLEGKLTWITEKLSLREIAGATLATQIFVLPIILWMMGSLSLIAPITNLLALAVIPSAMFFAATAGALAFLSSMLAAPFAFGAYVLLSYVLLIVEWGSKVPFASISVNHFPVSAMVSLYLAYGVIALAYRYKDTKYKTAPSYDGAV